MALQTTRRQVQHIGIRDAKERRYPPVHMQRDVNKKLNESEDSKKRNQGLHEVTRCRLFRYKKRAE